VSTPHLPASSPMQAGHARQGGGPNSVDDPEYFDGIPIKRVCAYIVDVIIIAIFAAAVAVIAFVPVVVTLGMLKPFVVGVIALIPLSYHTLLIGGDRSATVGMRLLDIEVRTMDGVEPGYVVALIQTVLFYVTISLTTWLILLVALFNNRHRTVHDFLCGTLIVNVIPNEATSTSPRAEESGPSAAR
jgi:uncharacterized RDD family membrane protein YckC